MSDHHILVIDDDERLRLLLRRFLEESGLRVTDAGSAIDARKFLDVIAFDLLVVDIMMPGETGLELLADIRQNNNVPALFLTAMSDTEHRIEGLEAGADDYMSKPFEPRELVLRIKQILARHKSLKTIASTLSFGPFLFNPETGILNRTGSRIISPQPNSNYSPASAKLQIRSCPVIFPQHQTGAWKAGRLMLQWHAYDAK